MVILSVCLSICLSSKSMLDEVGNGLFGLRLSLGGGDSKGGESKEKGGIQEEREVQREGWWVQGERGSRGRGKFECLSLKMKY